mgnify:CR=1 FL=1
MKSKSICVKIVDDYYSWMDHEDPFFDYDIDYFKGSGKHFIGKTINYPFEAHNYELISATLTHSSGVIEHLIQWNDFTKYLKNFTKRYPSEDELVKRAIQELRGNWGENNRGKGCIPEIPIGLFVFLIDEDDLNELAKTMDMVNLCNLMGHFGLSGTELVYYRKGDGFVQLEWKDLHPFIDEVLM